MFCAPWTDHIFLELLFDATVFLELLFDANATVFPELKSWKKKFRGKKFRGSGAHRFLGTASIRKQTFLQVSI